MALCFGCHTATIVLYAVLYEVVPGAVAFQGMYFLSAYCEDTREIAAPSALALPLAINYGQVPHASALAGATALCACRAQRTVECFRARHAQG